MLVVERKTSKKRNNNNSAKTRITVAHGDEIGPETMNATLRILEAAEAPLVFEPISIGEALFLSGIDSKA